MGPGALMNIEPAVELNTLRKNRQYLKNIVVPPDTDVIAAGINGDCKELQIYLDHSIMEVFANGRQCMTQRIWPTRDDSLEISFFSSGGKAKVRSVEAWDMSAISLTRRSRNQDGTWKTENILR